MNNEITDKEWLDLAWKYFQQHAQQRISYFNFFIVSSTVLTTGSVGTFQKGMNIPYIGILLGIIQILMSFIFWKIDQRNSFLTKHAEKTLIQIEKKYESNYNYKLFTLEAKKTALVNSNTGFFLIKQISHGMSYRIAFLTFFLIGLVGVYISAFFQ